MSAGHAHDSFWVCRFAGAAQPIHLTYNHVIQRMLVFSASNFVLVALWVLAGIGCRPILNNVNGPVDYPYFKTYASVEEPSMTTLSASDARANLYRLMDQAAESHQPITITGKRHDAVLLSAEDWQAIQETLYLLSVPGMRESIKEGMAETTESCAKELDW